MLNFGLKQKKIYGHQFFLWYNKIHSKKPNYNNQVSLGPL